MNRKNILIVDDDNSTRLLLDVLLRTSYKTNTQKTAIDALLWLSYGNIPDLILLDMCMPHFDGTSFLKNIRTSGFYKHIPVLMLSANEAQNEIDEALEWGVDGFVRKPFKPIELQQKIQHLLA